MPNRSSSTKGRAPLFMRSPPAILAFLSRHTSKLPLIGSHERLRPSKLARKPAKASLVREVVTGLLEETACCFDLMISGSVRSCDPLFPKLGCQIRSLYDEVALRFDRPCGGNLVWHRHN